MKSIMLAIAALAIPGPGAAAGDGIALKGLFCRTEAQINDVRDHLRAGIAPPAAAAMMNRDALHCVYADRIDYVVVDPVIIDGTRGAGASFVAYEATLTGIRVGGNLRPVDPPMPVFFITPGPVAGAMTLGKA